MENWFPVFGYENRYSVNTNGEIKSLFYGRIMKPSINKKGYYIVNLTDGKKTKKHNLHSVICLSILGPKTDGYLIRHKNGAKLDNRIQNLCYDTPESNYLDKIRFGEMPKGEKHWNAKLTQEKAEKIKIDIKNKIRSIDIAKKYQISPQLVCDIKKGRKW